MPVIDEDDIEAEAVAGWKKQCLAAILVSCPKIKQVHAKEGRTISHPARLKIPEIGKWPQRAQGFTTQSASKMDPRLERGLSLARGETQL